LDRRRLLLPVAERLEVDDDLAELRERVDAGVRRRISRLIEEVVHPESVERRLHLLRRLLLAEVELLNLIRDMDADLFEFVFDLLPDRVERRDLFRERSLKSLMRRVESRDRLRDLKPIAPRRLRLLRIVEVIDDPTVALLELREVRRERIKLRDRVGPRREFARFEDFRLGAGSRDGRSIFG
jgi:hypothetical protein